MAASYAQLGDTDEARAALEDALALRPNLTLNTAALFYRAASEEHRGRYLGALRMAGLEE